MPAPAPERPTQTARAARAGRTLVVGCAALARDLRLVLEQLGVAGSVDLELLPAPLHNRPEKIPERVAAVIDERRPDYEHVVVAYADCGTGGVLDAALGSRRVERLPGAHCYEFFAGSNVFAALCAEEPGTFFLTDFLARHFDALVWGGLGLDRHPELRDDYFRHYRRVVFLAQEGDAATESKARRAADRLELEFEIRRIGRGPVANALDDLINGGRP